MLLWLGRPHAVFFPQHTPPGGRGKHVTFKMLVHETNRGMFDVTPCLRQVFKPEFVPF